MKKILYTIAICFFLFSCAKQAGYEIKGSLTGVTKAKISLMRMIDGSFVTVDSLETADGKFVFKGTVAIPEMYYIKYSDEKSPLKFFIENSPIEVTVDSAKTTVTGSKSNDQWLTFSKQSDEFDARIDAEMKKCKEAKDAGKCCDASSCDSTCKAIQKEQKAFMMRYVETNKNNAVGAFVAFKPLGWMLSVDELAKIAGSFNDSIASSIYITGMKARVEVMKKVAIGQPAPEITMNDTTGKAVLLSSLKGKVVLIDFWASWCPDCRAEMPNVSSIYNDFHPKGFEIYGVSLDKKKAPWVKYIAENKLTWTNVSDILGWANAAGKLYAVSSIPHTVLVDKDGKIIANDLFGDDLRKKVEEVCK